MVGVAHGIFHMLRDIFVNYFPLLKECNIIFYNESLHQNNSLKSMRV